MKKLTFEQLRNIESIFEQAIERQGFERASFLDATCADDAGLREAVESLIQSLERAGDFLETLAIDEVFSATESPPLPDCIAHYKIIREIGRGGMGEVFLAHDTKLERPVALK